MAKRYMSWIWGTLTALLLLGVAYLVPSGAVLPQAQRTYMENTPIDSEDDEYSFLFDEEEPEIKPAGKLMVTPMGRERNASSFT